jgi:hypothetical protein
MLIIIHATILTYFHVFMAPWPIVTGFGWMIGFINSFYYNHLYSQSITITHNQSSDEPFILDCRGLAPRLTSDQSQSQSHIATDGQSISKSWCRATSWTHDQIFITPDSYGLVFVGRPLCWEDGFVFCICCWPSPGSLSRVRVPWDSWPYFTVSDLRLLFSSPPTTRRVTVEVFEPASTQVCL